MPTTWELCCGKEEEHMEGDRPEEANKKVEYLQLPEITGYIRYIILSPSTIMKITIFVSI